MVHIVKDAHLFRKKVAKSNFYSCLILSEHCAVVRCNKTRVILNKPIYLTGTVLDLSKYRMVEFFYQSLKKAFDIPKTISLTLHMTDTDCFIFSVKTPPGSSASLIWKQYATIAKALDLSSFDETHPFFEHNPEEREKLLSARVTSKGQLGLFKSEVSGMIKNGVFLKPKIYSLECYSTHTMPYSTQNFPETYELKRLKGMSRTVVEREISHRHYVDSLVTEKPQRHTMYVIRSLNHILYIQELTKSTLSLFDNKRFWMTKYVSKPF